MRGDMSSLVPIAVDGGNFHALFLVSDGKVFSVGGDTTFVGMMGDTSYSGLLGLGDAANR